MAQDEVNLNERLNYVQMAKEKMLDDPRVMHTLSWLYYLHGS